MASGWASFPTRSTTPRSRFAAGSSAHCSAARSAHGTLRAIELLGTDEAHTVYIGDSDVDIQTAQAAGIPCCPVGWGYRTAAFLRENGAKEVFETPEALYNRLTALFAQRG